MPFQKSPGSQRANEEEAKRSKIQYPSWKTQSQGKGVQGSTTPPQIQQWWKVKNQILRMSFQKSSGSQKASEEEAKNGSKIQY
mmetsp:Transcript_11344/g.21448  ORF Transcript_11344/g.21448 Transcript_11344/m.21448 type:complete len:83 (+) Transcript_11344:203-451(+)